MTAFSARIIPAKKLKNGRYNIKIAVCHNGQTLYISTNLYIANDRQICNGIVVRHRDARRYNDKLRELIYKYQEMADEMDDLSQLSCRDLLNRLLRKDGETIQTLKDLYEDYVSVAKWAPRSISLSQSCFRSIDKHMGGDTLIRSLSYRKVIALDKALRDEGNAPSTIRTKMALLAKMLVFARRCRYIPYDFRPMDGYKYPQAGVREIWLSVQQMRQLRDAKIKGEMERTTRDFIMLSYFLGGINISDLLSIDFAAVKSTGKIKYVRKKTEAIDKVNNAHVSFAGSYFLYYLCK